jgi:hypothetical protein
MIDIIDEKPIPIYEVTCPECGSVLEYTAADVSYSHITCPVCRSSVWAMTLMPKRYKNRISERSEDGEA